jgi:hypothetical protein
MFRGVFANLRSGQDSAQSPETTVPSAWAPPAESITAHKSVPSEADLEEVEGLEWIGWRVVSGRMLNPSS